MRWERAGAAIAPTLHLPARLPDNVAKRQEQMSLLVLIYHRMTESGAGAANVHCLSFAQFRDQVRYVRDNGLAVASWQRGAVSPFAAGVQIAFSFDDGSDSDLRCARLLQEAGFGALFFIITGLLDQPGYLRRADVAELRKMGMTIGSHTHTHAQLTSLDDARAQEELATSRDILAGIIDEPIEHFSFPGGAYDARTVAMARAAGYRFLSTSDWGLNRSAQLQRGILRRNSVLNHLDLEQFDDLLKQRNYHMRQAAFRVKELLKSTLGENRYVHIREALLAFRRSRSLR
jgi:peptidoglycan/xylan/chitin deacetylase (PgdA/CDA1 family)